MSVVSLICYLSIYLAREQQRLVANSLHPSLFIARYQASQRPIPYRSLRNCSAHVVLGRPLGRFQPSSGALPQRTPSAVHRASWAGTPGCIRDTCPKSASLLRLILGSMSLRRVLSLTSAFVTKSNQRIPSMRRRLRMWKACRRSISALSRVHVSAQYSSTERTHVS